MKKSQSAIEFLVFFALAVVILMMYLSLSYNFLGITLNNKDNVLAGDLAKELKNEINLAGLSNEGYQKEFIPPTKLNNKDYSISIPEGYREVTITLEGNSFTESLATKIDTSPTIITQEDTITIKKENDGRITISIISQAP